MEELIKSMIDELNQYQLGNANRISLRNNLRYLAGQLELDRALEILEKHINEVLPWKEGYDEDKYIERVNDLFLYDLQDRLIKRK